MRKCSIPGCQFTVDMGDEDLDTMEMASHWHQHSNGEKEAYHKQNEMLASMTKPRLSNPIAHWESRLYRIERDLTLLKWEVCGKLAIEGNLRVLHNAEIKLGFRCPNCLLLKERNQDQGAIRSNPNPESSEPNPSRTSERPVNIAGYESARIELEEEFVSAQVPDRKDAIVILAHEVERQATLRKCHPEVFTQ
jgi:hypothetical protein